MSLSIQQERVIHYIMCVIVVGIFWYTSYEMWQSVLLFLLCLILTFIHERITDIHQKVRCKRPTLKRYIPNHLASLSFGCLAWYLSESISTTIAVWFLLVILTCAMSLLKDLKREFED